MGIYSRYPLQFGKEVEALPDILDLRASNLAGDLSTGEKDAIRLKIGTAISPAPFLDEVIPDSYLPSTTGMFKLKGSFFTENMTVTTTGGTVNYITFNNDNDVDVNITTGATEGSFPVTIDNGISKTFSEVLLIVLGNVIKPITANWLSPVNINIKDDELNILFFNSIGSAQWDRDFDYTRNWSFRFKPKLSPLGEINSGDIVSGLKLNTKVGDTTIFDFRIYNHSTQFFKYFPVLSGATNYTSPGFITLEILSQHFIEIRYIEGVIYMYYDNVIVKTSSTVLTEDLKLMVSISQFDLEDIKYIELA